MGDKYAIKKKLDLWTGDDKLFIEKQVSAADVGAGIGTMIGFFINAHGANKLAKANTFLQQVLKSIEQGRLADAISSASHVISMYPGEEDGYVIRGVCLLESGNYAEAVKDISKAIQLDNKQGNYYIYRGRSYFYQQDLASAFRDFSQAVQLQPNHYGGYLWLGIALRSLEDYEQSLVHLDKALEKQPGDDEIYRQRAITYVRKGDYQKAIADISRTITLTPGSSWDLQLRAALYEFLGDEDKYQADTAQIQAIRSQISVTEQRTSRIVGTWRYTGAKGGGGFMKLLRGLAELSGGQIKEFEILADLTFRAQSPSKFITGSYEIINAHAIRLHREGFSAVAEFDESFTTMIIYDKGDLQITYQRAR